MFFLPLPKNAEGEFLHSFIETVKCTNELNLVLGNPKYKERNSAEKETDGCKIYKCLCEVKFEVIGFLFMYIKVHPRQNTIMIECPLCCEACLKTCWCFLCLVI